MKFYILIGSKKDNTIDKNKKLIEVTDDEKNKICELLGILLETK